MLRSHLCAALAIQTSFEGYTPPMKRFILITVLLALPSVSSAFFIDDFYPMGERTEFMRPVQQSSSLESLPGWPTWVGRLDDFSLLLFGRRYENLTRSQQVEVRALSKEWPDWIDVPQAFR